MRLLIRPLGLRVIPLIVLDGALVYGSYAGALLLRFDGDVPARSWTEFWQVTPFIAAGYVAANFIFGIYHSAWKYRGMSDLSPLAVPARLLRRRRPEDGGYPHTRRARGRRPPRHPGPRPAPQHRRGRPRDVPDLAGQLQRAARPLQEGRRFG